MTRSKNSIRNLSFALIGQGIGLIISFFARIVFIKTLGSEYLGLNGLFTNLLTVLSLAELGVGEAITYSLYKPLAEQDTHKCKMLMQLYKKIYTIIGFAILIIGISITPLLPFLINNMPNIDNIYLIYILFVINTAISYFFSYKRNLIIADQNRYIATIYRYIFYFFLNVCQIIYLLISANYIGFLILQIVYTLLENIFISHKADKMYPYLKEKKKIKLDKETKQDIIKNTKAMLMHRIGGIIVSSTDNIILSSCINITAVALYSNYSLIINALNIIITQVFSSILASIGNLYALTNKEKQYEVYNKINFLCFWISSTTSICLICLFNSFIEIWIGKQYLFNMNIVLILVVNYYITMMRKANITFRDASGMFYKDRWKAVFEALINLVVSILLVKKIGISGVFLGTIISSITTCVWVEPYILFKHGFKQKLSLYFKQYFKYTLTTIILGGTTYFLCTLITGNIYIVFIVKSLISLIIPNLILILIHKDNTEFKYFCNLIKKIIKKHI